MRGELMLAKLDSLLRYIDNTCKTIDSYDYWEFSERHGRHGDGSSVLSRIQSRKKVLVLLNSQSFAHGYIKCYSQGVGVGFFSAFCFFEFHMLFDSV